MPPASSCQFSVSYDRTTKIISVVASGILLIAAVAAHIVIIGCISALIVFLGFAYSPRRYTVSAQAITVKRLIGNVRFPLQGVAEARRTTADDLRGIVRLWGSGGLFGYYGFFRTLRLGRCWWYVTNRRNMVVIVTDRKTALFSPDDVDGFLAAIRASVPVPSRPVERVPEQPHGRSRLLGVSLGAGIAALTVALIVFAFSYSPGPPRLTLTPDSLTIHDRFYPVTVRAADVDAARIRVVDIMTDGAWRPTLRTNGFSNSHYHSGWFRLANGQSARMYWANGRRLVLLPPKGNGNPVLVEVDHAEGFVQQLLRQWGSGG